jgi:hypothetical protein
MPPPAPRPLPPPLQQAQRAGIGVCKHLLFVYVKV